MATSAKSGAKPTKASAAAKAVPDKKAAKPAAKSAAKSVSKPATKPAAKVAAPKKATAGKSAKSPGVTPEQRRFYVEVAAYYIAERRGFHGGSELDDWVQAELEIDRLLHEGVLNPA